MVEQTSKDNKEPMEKNIGDEEEEEEEGGIRIGDIYLPPPPPPACTLDSTGPRLVITHIENNFFKSYANKQVLGPFHKSFTSIIGPNGSGKSNVIDSMLFVFGYRAQKIRSKKVSVLIHNSETYPNVQSCTVAVHFRKIIDCGEDFEVVPNSDFVVSRTAFKDNSSFYQVDGKRCQFKVVSKLLRSHGIDLDHNRFLILQGEVEQIAMMKPKAQTEHDTGMLEYLEDIVGSSRFKEPIDLLSKRVEDLNEQRTEKLNRVKMVEKEKDDMEGPKNEAVTHLKQENEVTLKKNKLFQRFIMDSNEAKDKAETKKKEIDDGMADINKQLADFDEKKQKENLQIREIGKQMDQVVKEKEESSERFKALESRDATLQEELKHKNQKRKKLKVQIITEKNKLEELEGVPAKSEKEIEECEDLKEKLEESRKKEEAAYHKAMDSINSETQQLQEEKKVFETKLIGLKETSDEKKSALDIAQSELDIYQSTAKKEQKLLEQYESSLEKAISLGVDRKKEVEKLNVAVPENEQTIHKNKKELQHIVPKLQELEEHLKNSRAKLEETRSAMQSTSSRSRVLDALMNQKKTGDLPGIYGRLGDLGGIDAKYDVAISTACGPLDNVVVDTVDTGSQCIQFLKKNNIGSSTFIALDKMEKWRGHAGAQINTPENVPRLYDLIKVNDERVKTAFYFSVRDTLVATDLDQASRIAYGKGRHRVVTLKGELIEPSGTMSGGGRSVLRGRMGKSASVANIDPREVVATEQKVEQLTNQASHMRRERAELEDSLQTLARDLNIMKTNLARYKKDIQGSQEHSKVLETQVKEQNKKVKCSQPDPNKLQSYDKDIQSKLKLYDCADAAARKVEVNVNEVHAQIVEITGGKTKKIKKALQETNKKLEKVKAEITRLQVAIKTAKRNFTKLTDKIAVMETEVKETESELLAYKANKTKIEEAAAKDIQTYEEKVDEEAKLKVAINKLKEKFDAISKQENDIKSEQIEIDQELEKYGAMIRENKGKLVHWKKQLKRLELVDVPLSDDDGECAKTLAEIDASELREIDPKNLQCQITVTEEKLSQGRPNLAVLQEYRKKEEIYLKRAAELESITGLRNEQRGFHEDLRKQRLNEFMSGFNIVSNKLKEMYQMITLGGDAELELVDSLDPFSEGIVFSVRPPKKSWKNITNLSGGEKTLSSLALVFALHYYKPTPLYVMDEIDAALDFKNVSIVGNYIKERTRNAQFIIISLRSQMFELADRLVGIYKTSHCTKSAAINPATYVKKEETTIRENISVAH